MRAAQPTSSRPRTRIGSRRDRRNATVRSASAATPRASTSRFIVVNDTIPLPRRADSAQPLLQAGQGLWREIEIGREFLLRDAADEFGMLALEAQHPARSVE